MTFRRWTIDIWRTSITEESSTGFRPPNFEVAAKLTCDIFRSTNRGCQTICHCKSFTVTKAVSIRKRFRIMMTLRCLTSVLLPSYFLSFCWRLSRCLSAFKVCFYSSLWTMLCEIKSMYVCGSFYRHFANAILKIVKIIPLWIWLIFDSIKKLAHYKYDDCSQQAQTPPQHKW